MRGRQWFAGVLAASLVCMGAAVGANYATDVYGLYRAPTGRSLPVSYNERQTKFLYGMNYIPANFSGVLIGSSITENWDTSKITVARVYNASMSGANVSEEALIARAIFARKRLRLVIVTVFPYQTASFGPKSGYMTQDGYWSGLGSVSLLRVYAAQAQQALLHRAPENDAFGVALTPPAFVGGARILTKRPETVDPRAFEEFRALVAEAHQHAEQVVAVVPPYFSPVWRQQEAFFSGYNRRALSAFRPDDIVVDFNRSEYQAVTSEPENFPDGAHISSKAVPQLIAAIEHAVRHPSQAVRVRQAM